MEQRFNPTEVRAEGGKIRGTASPTYNGEPGTEYELWPGVFERFAPGAFDKYLATKPDVVALFNHDDSQILGRTPNTLRLSTDERGLHYEIDVPDTQAGRDLLVSISRGDVRGSSFAFSPLEVEWRMDGPKEIRLVREATLGDVSPVTRPAYTGSTVGYRSTEERAALEDERDAYKAKLETERRFARLEKLLGTTT